MILRTLRQRWTRSSPLCPSLVEDFFLQKYGWRPCKRGRVMGQIDQPDQEKILAAICPQVVQWIIKLAQTKKQDLFSLRKIDVVVEIKRERKLAFPAVSCNRGAKPKQSMPLERKKNTQLSLYRRHARSGPAFFSPDETLFAILLFGIQAYPSIEHASSTPSSPFGAHISSAAVLGERHRFAAHGKTGVKFQRASGGPAPKTKSGFPSKRILSRMTFNAS